MCLREVGRGIFGIGEKACKFNRVFEDLLATLILFLTELLNFMV